MSFQTKSTKITLVIRRNFTTPYLPLFKYETAMIIFTYVGLSWVDDPTPFVTEDPRSTPGTSEGEHKR
jgi:hypothetical protein